MEEILSILNQERSEVDLKIIISSLFISSGLGVVSIIFASFNKYAYLRDSYHILIGALLPCIGYIIVYVIGSNLALSLGMIGALSIIRFRTPVRSSYELIIYFLLLTIGISMKVNLFIALTLALFSILCFIIINEKTLSILHLKKISKIFDNNYLNNKKFTILVDINYSKENEQKLLLNKNLLSLAMNSDKSNILSLNLNFELKEDLNSFLKLWEKDIISYDIYSSDKV